MIPRTRKLIIITSVLLALLAVHYIGGTFARIRFTPELLQPDIQYTQPITSLNDPRVTSVIILFAILAGSAAISSGVSAWLLQRRITEQHKALETASARILSMDANQDAVLRALPDLIFTYDAEARFSGYMTSDVDNFAIPPELFMNRNCFEVFGEKDYHEKTLHAVTRALAGEGIQVFEYELPSIAPDRLFEARFVRLEEGKALSMIRDITERRKIEQMKDASIREKESLLKEIHHRVKNNLQIVSSLLSMQSSKVRDEYDKELFIESQGRIRAMSAVHDQLYRSRDFASIPAAEYLSDLMTGLESSWARADRRLCVSVKADDTALELEQAVPMGLIVNELATNAFKYAFGPGDSGTISVTLCHVDDGTVSLVVSDDGHGFPQDFDAAKGDGGMGFTIINALVEQIGGTMSMAIPEAGGSEITILVPPAKKNQP